MKVLDRLVTRVAREIRLLEQALKATNARTTVDAYDQDEGAIASLAVMWRLPVLHARDPENALRILRFLAQQMRNSEQRILRRYDRKPKRIASRRLYMLQALSGVGPALAKRLLIKFGSVERVVTVDEESLTQVRGIGLRKAARIRELVGG